jgi:hypothetical protein
VDVVSSVPEVDDWVLRLFAPFLRDVVSQDMQDSSEDRQAVPAFRLFYDPPKGPENSQSRLRLQRPGKKSISAQRPAGIAGELEYAVFDHVTWNLKRYFQLHAAFVAKGESGLLIPGGTRTGKTTLTLTLWQSGWEVFSDDMSFLEPDGMQFLPFPRPLTLREGTLELLGPEGSGSEIPMGPPDYEETTAYFHPLWLSPDGGGDSLPDEVPQPSQARWILFPTRRARARKKPDLRPLKRTQAIRKLAPHAYIFEKDRVRGLEILSDLVNTTEQYELIMGSPEETCGLIDSALGSSHSQEGVAAQVGARAG